MTIAEQLARAKTDLDDVYEAGYNKGLNDAPPSGDYQDGFAAGKQAEYDAFWDGYQNSGNRTDYAFAFAGLGWTQTILKPKHPLIVSYAFEMFRSCELIDLTAIGVTVDFSTCTSFSNFAHSSRLTRVGEISTVNATSLPFTFYNCQDLVTIDKIVLKADGSQTFQSCFDRDDELVNITFEGVIGQSIGFAQSNLLTVASMDSIYTALKDYTSNAGAYTLTLHATAWTRWDAAKPDLVSQYGSMKNYVTTTKGWATS